VLLKHFPQRVHRALQAAYRAFQKYDALDYNGNMKIYSQRACDHCDAPWSTYHCDLYLCEECMDEYGDDHESYHSVRVLYREAYERLQFQIKWYKMPAEVLDTHWWLFRKEWNDVGHWEYFLNIIKIVRHQPAAVYFFAQHNLDMTAAWDRYDMYDPTGRGGMRLQRRADRQWWLMRAVDETVRSMRRDTEFTDYGPGEEFEMADISEPWGEDLEYQLKEYCERKTVWYTEDRFEYFTWGSFVVAFWDVYPNVFLDYNYRTSLF
jgi:hypothetical protein